MHFTTPREREVRAVSDSELTSLDTPDRRSNGISPWSFTSVPGPYAYRINTYWWAGTKQQLFEEPLRAFSVRQVQCLLYLYRNGSDRRPNSALWNKSNAILGA
uniref:Uncharacterized protein n=1 Tax=Picea glauca TaxID=3330 RepID=A0A101M415_PICGL|nr:hypothetical protein ABT39_MTgene393 [Picea glauca]